LYRGFLNLLSKEEAEMPDQKRIRDVMSSIEEYSTLNVDAKLSDALAILKRNHEEGRVSPSKVSHKTIFITDAAGRIIGKLSLYDLLRGLVPEGAKAPEHFKAFYSMLSSRALDVSREVSETQERFRWLHSTFSELVKQEAQKGVKEIMSPVHPLLEEDDTLNKAIYVMFKENIRQPLVVRDGKIVGVVDFMGIFDELLEVVADEG